MKRAGDVLFSVVLLILLSPVLLFVAVAVLATLGFPVLFRQKRPGLGGKPFTLIKFRTMRSPENEEEASVSQDARRLTRFGSFLRRTSLDELPQLWNVLVGDLSLVGPRPLLMQYLDRYTPEQRRRHEVRPGITGWAQVHGRNSLSWEEKFDLDVWYVDHASFFLDLKILLLTLGRVVGGRGVNQSEGTPMTEFLGTGKADGNARG